MHKKTLVKVDVFSAGRSPEPNATSPDGDDCFIKLTRHSPGLAGNVFLAARISATLAVRLRARHRVRLLNANVAQGQGSLRRQNNFIAFIWQVLHCTPY